MKTIVALSGGLDSTTALALMLQDNSEVEAVAIKYGQKHQDAELKRAQQVAEYYQIPFDVIELPPRLFKGAVSALIDDGAEMPLMTYEEILESEGPSPTVVPFRNAHIVATLTTLAEIRNAAQIVLGIHALDAHNAAYPDCTPPFLHAMQLAVSAGTYEHVSLQVPFETFTKRDVCIFGIELKAPYHLTWSCYTGREKQCGVCPTCVERIDAFKAAGVIDPVPYEIEIDWGDAAPFIKPKRERTAH